MAQVTILAIRRHYSMDSRIQSSRVLLQPVLMVCRNVGIPALAPPRSIRNISSQLFPSRAYL